MSEGSAPKLQWNYFGMLTTNLKKHLLLLHQRYISQTYLNSKKHRKPNKTNKFRWRKNFDAELQQPYRVYQWYDQQMDQCLQIS